MPLVLGSHDFGDDELLVMAIVNRTPDSFYDRGATFHDSAALERVGPRGPNATSRCRSSSGDVCSWRYSSS